jgi:hypothetical protein
MNANAQLELQNVDLSKVLDFGWSQEELSLRLQAVFEDGFQDLLDELMADLTPDQFDSLSGLLSKEGMSPQDIQDVFVSIFPNYSDSIRDLALKQKSNLLSSYVELLKVNYANDALMSSVLEEVTQLIADGEWLAAERALLEIQKEE